jgi:hypothetical protein
MYLNEGPLVEVAYQVVKDTKEASYTWEKELVSTLLIGYTLCLEAFQHQPQIWNQWNQKLRGKMHNRKHKDPKLEDALSWWHKAKLQACGIQLSGVLDSCWYDLNYKKQWRKYVKDTRIWTAKY